MMYIVVCIVVFASSLKLYFLFVAVCLFVVICFCLVPSLFMSVQLYVVFMSMWGCVGGCT